MSKINRKTPRRLMDKREAIRHLIHTAVRMIAMEEDPFAIQVLIQCADKVLIDIAKRTGRKLMFRWEERIRPEYREEFIRIHRETANFLKHADKDYDEKLHVGNITEMNVLILAVCICNYYAMYGEWTWHMQMFIVFARCYHPAGFVPLEQRLEFDVIAANLMAMTPRQFFQDWWDDPMFRKIFPALTKERTQDLADTFAFYSTRLSQREK
jgi:hypothetical protein